MKLIRILVLGLVGTAAWALPASADDKTVMLSVPGMI